jgi:hypothetical protein
VHGHGPELLGNLLLDEVLRRLEGRKAPAAFSGWSGLKAAREAGAAGRRATARAQVEPPRRGARAALDRQQRRCFVCRTTT